MSELNAALSQELEAVRDRIHNAMAPTGDAPVSGVRIQIQEAIRRAKASVEYADLAGLSFAPDEGGAHPYDVIECDLLEALLDVRVLRAHVHQWDSENRCAICGADGEA